MPEGYRGYHDLGGLEASAVDQTPHDPVLWEKRVDALMVLLSSVDHKLIRVDELRRAIESLGPEVYDNLSYYERWAAAIGNLLVEKGVLDQAEIDSRIAELKARGEGQA